MKGILTYWVRDGVDTLKSVRLTICSDDDISRSGSAVSRRKKLARILEESSSQNVHLSQVDLSVILLVSKATIKRDFSHFRQKSLSGHREGGSDG
jgi:NADH/NAD ratio-sensing transcriptional regulator Rex